jgi:hypothetical protein
MEEKWWTIKRERVQEMNMIVEEKMLEEKERGTRMKVCATDEMEGGQRREGCRIEW